MVENKPGRYDYVGTRESDDLVQCRRLQEEKGKAEEGWR